MERLEELKNNKEMFFNFMRNKYPIFFNSNIFLRDIQYAVHTFFGMRNSNLTYKESEKLALGFIGFLEGNNELIKLDGKTWKVNFHFNDVVKEEEAENPI